MNSKVDRRSNAPEARRRDGVPLSGGPDRSTTSSASSACRATGVEYRDKRLSINGAAGAGAGAIDDYLLRRSAAVRAQRYRGEAERRREHADPDRGGCPGIRAAECAQFPFRDNCDYNDDGFACTVPPGPLLHDGRQPGQQRATAATGGSCRTTTSSGKAFFIWSNFDELKRFGSARSNEREQLMRNSQRGVSLMGLIIGPSILIVCAAARHEDRCRLHRVLHRRRSSLSADRRRSARRHRSRDIRKAFGS